jgi:hypothetical protein
MFQARQGDVFVERVQMRARTGKAISDRGRVILAYGEATGHSHEVKVAERGENADGSPDAQLFEEPDGERFLFVKRVCVLSHDEHRPIPVEPGCYRVTIQREYEPAGARSVID